MPKHFTTEVAPALVFENPGMTDTEIATLALERGLVASNAKAGQKAKVHSEASSLSRMVREDRVPEIYREQRTVFTATTPGRLPGWE